MYKENARRFINIWCGSAGDHMIQLQNWETVIEYKTLLAIARAAAEIQSEGGQSKKSLITHTIFIVLQVKVNN